jgi:hypothetical protein
LFLQSLIIEEDIESREDESSIYDGESKEETPDGKTIIHNIEFNNNSVLRMIKSVRYMLNDPTYHTWHSKNPDPEKEFAIKKTKNQFSCQNLSIIFLV